MKKAMILPLLILCSAAVADAGVYKWANDQGVVSFSDNPAQIPSRYRSKAMKVEEDTSFDPKVLQELREEVEKPRHDKTATPRAVTTADSEQAAPVTPGRQQEIKGHLGGDQTDPAVQSVKKTLPVTPGRQQEIKGHLGGDQTDPTPPSMTQPKPIPPGEQPKPAPADMEQPTPMK
ncbi:MAG: DUF4124 domain-containing protein [Oryzomonas sp.]|uniref:DUF4124 domain-containing protein n=1 Tax=Oryzomonas sp. TaxID=2855186 RepID=UPI0028471EDD|nr:DUF4124 domain-containing protein [Oryzomonas sp.]MDR3579618.1 DUF4124 domain-containing protein [Oryzomonas sp.]